MKKLMTTCRRLLAGILCVLLFMGAQSVVAASQHYSEGDIASYEAVIPVSIIEVVDSTAKIEQLEGPREILPSPTVLTPDADGNGEFRMSFADAAVGDVYKYRITEVPGTDPVVDYNITNKTYICEVWIFENADPSGVYARSFLYESEEPLDLTADEHKNIPKPEKCLFENEANPEPPSPIHATSRGKKGETQASDGSAKTIDKTGEVAFIKGTGNFVKMQLIDPHTGKPTDATTVDALDENGKKVGTYRLKSIDLETGKAIVEFVSNPDFVGSPRPAQVQVLDSKGFTAVAKYTPYVVGPPDPQNAETWGNKGEKQTSRKSVQKVLFKKGDGKFVSMKLLDPYTGKPTDKTTIDALDKNGKVIGKYRLVDVDLENGEGTVEFIPNPDFVGDPQPCGVRVVDEFGYESTAWYQPHVAERNKPSSTVKPASPGRIRPVKTGDTQGLLLFAIGFVAAAALLIYGLKRKQKHQKK